MMSRNVVLLLAGLLLISACTPNPRTLPPEEEARRVREERKVSLRQWIEGEKRLQAVGFAMLGKLGNHCREHYRNWTGARFTRATEFDQKWGDAFQAEYDLKDQVKVLYTLPDSPAEAAGLRPGDVPVTLNGEPVDNIGTEGYTTFTEHLEKLANEPSPQLYGVMRDGQFHQVMVTPRRVCDLEFVVSMEPGRRIYSDYNQIIVTVGMLELLYDDRQLAYALAQQIVHNLFSHLDSHHRHALISATGAKMLELLIEAVERHTQWNFERCDPDQEANHPVERKFTAYVDTASLYLAASIGYNLDEAPAFWRRMANGQGLVDFYRAPPITPERLEGIAKSIEKIQQELALGDQKQP